MTAPADNTLDSHAPPDRIGLRYIVTLAAQGLRLLSSLVVAMIVPRTLGPAMYGNYTFLLSTAGTLRAFVDTSTQQAFFTFSSQQRASGALTRLYACALLGQFALVMLIVAFAIATRHYDWLWHGQQPQAIVWVTVLDWAVYFALSLQQLGDSKGLTVIPQIIGAVVACVALLALLVLWRAGALDFYTFVWLNLSAACANAVSLGAWLLRRHRALLWDGVVVAGSYVRRWWVFARPLILLQVYLPLVAYLGIYLVQRWDGPVEQGFYALALQWSSLALVFTNAGVSIFWREMAYQSASADPALAARTYSSLSRLLFFIAIVLACWISASSATLVDVIAGPRFASAVMVVAIMAFYPAAQTLGQLSTAALKATERTAQYARWSVALSIPDLLLTYFLLAPASAKVPGLGLGAIGMAIKTALYGLISVQVFDWINCRSMRIKFAPVLLQRVAAMGLVGAAAWSMLKLGGDWLRSDGWSGLGSLLLSSTIYGLVVLGIFWSLPALAGVSRQQIRGVLPGGSR